MISVIGDGQSLAQSLSTFSAQMKSIEGMLRDASKGVLLLIDELAAGTDPGEGIALSIAILEELSRKGANIIVTTHFNELKAFAAATAGFQNARMEFDKETLQPLYRLTIGEAGRVMLCKLLKSWVSRITLSSDRGRSLRRSSKGCRKVMGRHGQVFLAKRERKGRLHLL